MRQLIPTLLFSASLTAAVASPGDFNPILPDWIADPSVSKFGDTFYLYGTTDIDKELSMAGVPVVWKSKDFVNWSFEGPAVEGVDWQKNLGGYYRYWAPGKVIRTGNRYHLYVTIVDPKGNPAPTVLMTADKPDGPFRFAETVPGDDAANGPLNRAQVAAAAVAPDIDGDPFVDDDGTAYIVWRKRWIAKLNADRTKIDGRPVELRTALRGYSEGPCLFKRNGIYYYFYTIGGCDGYHYGYMMSKESPLAGWTDPKDPVVVASNYAGGVWGPGHGNVFESNGEYYLVYLEYGEGGTTRQVMANRLEFAADGTIERVVPTRAGVGYLGPDQETRENLAPRAMWTASSVRGPRLTRGRTHRDFTRTFSYDPQLAGDGDNGTRWVADGGDKAPWLQADFGRPTSVEEVKVFFTQPAFGHNWKLEGSLDGRDWELLGEETAKPCRSPHSSRISREVRYLRLSVLAGDPGVWEMKVYAPSDAAPTDRELWVKTLVKIVDPVITNLAAGTLHRNFPRRKGTWTDAVAELEAFGRVMTGLGPWLELPDDDTEEGKLRVRVREDVIRALDNITRPGSPDRMPFEKPGQTLVDAAFLAQGLMRARTNVWARVPEQVKTNVIEALKATRKMKPYESNWLLFASEIEAFLLEETGECDEKRLRYGIDAFMTRPGWYVGDGLYADGKDFAADGYNSFVIQPMLWDVANVLKRRGMKDGETYVKTIQARLRRYADLQERMIGPDGTYPLFGRSITYRFGTFQGLALAALLGPGNHPAKPGAVRGALTEVLKRQTGPENFLPGGWLTVGFNGDQPMLAERYIDYGSVYMCTAVFLPLGRPADDRFWTEPASEWTQKAAWSGRPARIDHRQ